MSTEGWNMKAWRIFEDFWKRERRGTPCGGTNQGNGFTHFEEGTDLHRRSTVVPYEPPALPGPDISSRPPLPQNAARASNLPVCSDQDLLLWVRWDFQYCNFGLATQHGKLAYVGSRVIAPSWGGSSRGPNRQLPPMYVRCTPPA